MNDKPCRLHNRRRRKPPSRSAIFFFYEVERDLDLLIEEGPFSSDPKTDDVTQVMLLTLNDENRGDR